MKAIINGLRYDTDKAILIGEASHNIGDFQYWEAGLHKTPRSGRFFLAGAGGPMTRWARSGYSANERCGGRGIIPLTADEALAWAEEYLTVEEVEAAFTKMVQEA